MIEQDRNGEKVLPISARGRCGRRSRLPNRACTGDGDQQERLLAKAASGQLARAIFNAAKSEHPERRIILRKDARVIVDSSSGKMR